MNGMLSDILSKEESKISGICKRVRREAGRELALGRNEEKVPPRGH